MSGQFGAPTIFVEGKDDLYAIVHLLIRHGIPYDRKPWPPGLPTFKPAEGVEELLSGIALGVKVSTNKTIGFVLDADSPLASRWDAVRRQLGQAGVDTPEALPTDGFTGESPKYRARVGVWLMPDNQQDGRLETLLQSLIDENDALINHAGLATCEAKWLGAKFSTPDLGKATLHTWLAWQEEPGKPYGTAIRAKYFGIDSLAARQFVAWFKRLFAIP